MRACTLLFEPGKWQTRASVGRRLQDLETPCLSAGSAKKPCFLPSELFSVRRGQRKPKLNERQANEMVKVAAHRPHERAAIINRNVSELSRLSTDPVAAAFQMQMQPTMINVCPLCPLIPYTCLVLSLSILEGGAYMRYGGTSQGQLMGMPCHPYYSYQATLLLQKGLALKGCDNQINCQTLCGCS